MTELAEDRPRVPEPPRLGPAVAVTLELSMLGTFISHGSIVGMLLWTAYFWFSASCAFLFTRR